MTAVERALAAVRGQEVDRTSSAAGLIMTTVEMMKSVGATYPEAHHNPQMMADMAAAAHEMCGVDGTTFPFDMSLEAEILGAELDWRKVDRPPIKTSPVNDPDNFTVPDKIEELGRIPVVLKTIDILKEKYGEDLAILPTTVCPFTIAGHMAGVDNLFMWILSDPDKVHTLVDKITGFVIEYQKLMAAHGADILFAIDPTSSGDLLSGDMYAEFVLPSIKKMKKGTGASTILHICGNTKPMLEHIAVSGVDAFSFDKAVPVWYAKQKLGNVSAYGNLDVIELFPNGTPDDVYNATAEVIRQGINIAGSACDVPETTPLENIRAFVKACEETPVPSKNDSMAYGKQLAAQVAEK
ncbi:MtaA/CmuA family methyltransferase [Methanimicrococcus blatticola]|nr:MtaA/CmuA family methyltransferase [Methanimicrococcus blatticola]MBZ3935455.1 MtaA/CmuA family methyltransferase [Methanimicrococcus blatticola]MCC2509099.1 MtaA/CmuA family methyltransferase [Methanimicrococcus blatticola]